MTVKTTWKKRKIVQKREGKWQTSFQKPRTFLEASQKTSTLYLSETILEDRRTIWMNRDKHWSLIVLLKIMVNSYQLSSINGKRKLSKSKKWMRR